jgi:pilus assembly protein CpaB
MNKRFVGVLTFAFLVAAGASLVLYRVLINRPVPTTAGPALAQVVLATKDLEVGTVLKEEDVKVADWPGSMPVGATTQVKDVIGRGVITAIFAKEPIIASRLAPKGAGGGMATMIPPGMRAVAVRVNEVVGVAGFVVPGTHVDILISGSAPGVSNSQGTLTQTLLQNIEVLSAGQDFKKDAEGKPIAVQVVNMLVTPTQAEQLSLASSSTSIQLVLRNPLDHDIAKTPGTALQRLFTNGKLALAPTDVAPRPRAVPKRPVPVLAAAPPPKEIPFVMEIISGNSKKEQKFGGSTEVSK